MSRNAANITKISTFMDDCKHLGIDVLGPDVNESYKKFTVNKKGQIRFGLMAIRGLGEGPADEILRERKENGPFKDVFDFVERVNLNTVNKRVIEAMVLSGGFDNISEFKRSDFFKQTAEGQTFIEALLKYGAKMQHDNDPNQTSLFGGADSQVKIKKPEPPQGADDWTELEKLDKEKEYIGMYLSDHPLAKDKHIIDAQTNVTLAELDDLTKFKHREIKIAGLVNEVQHRFTKTGKPWGSFVIEDFTGSFRIALFSKQYIDFKKYLEKGYKLFITGKVEHRYNDKNQFEFRVSSINLLEDMDVKALAIKLKVEEVTNDLIGKLNNLFEQHKGKTQIKFLLYDPQTKVWVQMTSQNTTIEVDDLVIDFLKHEQLQYKLY